MNTNQEKLTEHEISDIIAQIESSGDEKEVRELTEKYSQQNPTIYNAGIVRWGELLGKQGEIVGFEVRKNYAVEDLIKVSSIKPVDGKFRTRNVKTGGYADNVKTMGEKHGFKVAFEVVNKVGRALYGDRFTLEIAKAAFVTACPYFQANKYLENVETWFCEMNKR